MKCRSTVAINDTRNYYHSAVLIYSYIIFIDLPANYYTSFTYIILMITKLIRILITYF